MNKSLLVFSATEYESRWKKVEMEMSIRGLETAVIWGRTASTFDRAADVIYLTNYFSTKVGQGFDSGKFSARAYCAVLFRVGFEPILIADDPDVRKEVVAVSDFRVADNPVSTLVDTLTSLKISGKVGFVGSDFFPMKYWNELQKITPNLTWEICDNLVRVQRLIKSVEEQEVIRIGGQIASPAMTRMMKALLSGKTEAEAAGLAAHDIVSAGGVIDKIQVSHGDTIGFTCGDPLTGYRKVAPNSGDLFRAFLIGPMYQGYYLDPGRTAVCGNKPSSDQINILEACENIISSMAASIKPGVSFEDAAKVGDKMVADFGPDADPAAEKFPFFGHPHGLYFEGPPYISTVLEHKNAKFETGMLIGLEAFLARKGVGNVGFEQNYLVKENGLELITTTPMLWH
ncbi:MAG: aminopeptidase P family protein [Rhodobacteraceae bacterium]|nr:aminopeptidase P family protein [Paracoccaceae bacterium]